MAADICVIMNTGSGASAADDRRREVEEAATPWPGRFDIRAVTEGARIVPAAREAVEEGFGTIVAAGGDGTIAAVAGVLAGTDRRMGVIAFGTFNYFARSLGIPEDTGEAVRLIATGEARPMDLGEVNGRVFLNNASLGAYPAILEHRERVYRRWGRSRPVAYLSVLLTLLRFRSPLRATLAVDGVRRPVRTPLLFVAKNDGQLEEVGLEGADCVRQGAFAVFLAPDAGRFGLLVFAFRLALGLSEPREDFELLCAREVVVETARPWRLVARDGEREKMRSPFVFRLRPAALAVILPPGAEA